MGKELPKTKKATTLTNEQRETRCLEAIQQALRRFDCQIIPRITLEPHKTEFKVNVVVNSPQPPEQK